MTTLFRLEYLDIQDHQDQAKLILIVKPKEAASTYEYEVDRRWLVQWLRDTLEKLEQVPYQEILEALKRIEDRLPAE